MEKEAKSTVINLAVEPEKIDDKKTPGFSPKNARRLSTRTIGKAGSRRIQKADGFRDYYPGQICLRVLLQVKKLNRTVRKRNSFRVNRDILSHTIVFSYKKKSIAFVTLMISSRYDKQCS